MKKNYLKLIVLLGLISTTAFAQSPTIHSVIDSTFNSDGSLAYTIDATTVASATGVTLTVTISPQMSDLEEIFDISINRDTDARLTDRVRIGKQIKLPANGTYVFVDEYANWTENANSDTGYVGSGAYPVGTPMFYSLSIARLPEAGGNTTPKRSYPAIYLPNAPDEVVVDALNDDMTLITRVYPNEDESSVVLAFDYMNYDYYQQVLLDADPGNILNPAGSSKLVYYSDILIDSDDNPNGRVDTGNENVYWGFEGSAYYKLDIAPEYIGNDGYAYLWLKNGRPGTATQTPIPVKLGVLSVNKNDVSTVRMYPNPSSGLVNFEGIKGVKQIQLLNVTGNVLRSKNIENTNTAFIDVTNIPSGVYLVAMQTDEGKFFNKLIVK